MRESFKMHARVERFEAREKGLIGGVAIVFDSLVEGARVPTVVSRGAFTKTLTERPNVPILWHHDRAEPIGTTVKLAEDAEGLQFEARLVPGIPRSDHAMRLMEPIPETGEPAMKGVSIGFSAIKIGVERYNPEKHASMIPPGMLPPEGIRFLKEVRLDEISLTPTPAQALAEVRDVFTVSDYAALPLAAEDYLPDPEHYDRMLAMAERFPEAMRRGFLMHDADRAGDGDRMLGYTMPIADVVNGELVAVPRLIFRAAAILYFGRGGRFSLPALSGEEHDQARAHLASYYQQLGRRPPWDRSDDELTRDLSLLERFASLPAEQATQAIEQMATHGADAGTGEAQHADPEATHSDEAETTEGEHSMVELELAMLDMKARDVRLTA